MTPNAFRDPEHFWLTGLASGRRYWLRVIAKGSASDPATKVAP